MAGHPSAGHLLANLLLFGRALRAAGLPVSPEQTADFARALELVDVGERSQVYHAARSLLVTRRSDLALFDALFHRFFRDEAASRSPRRRPPKRRRPRRRPFDVVSYLAARAGRDDPRIEAGDRTGTASSQEALRHKEFSAMSPEELDAVRRLIREMRFEAARRKTRRHVPDRGGRRIDLHRALRAWVKYGGAPPKLPRRAAKWKQRPLVLLADVSGSMEKTARLVLLFCYSLSHSLRDVETFVFGTRLSRITPQLALRNVDRAIEQAASEVVDWAGGTRIGDSLAQFNRRWGRRVLRRGAVVLVVSDGWERGDAAPLGREVAALRRRCHRLVWLNPLAGKATYEPRAAGMAAALPFVDDFLPIHNLDSLHRLARHLETLPARRGSVPVCLPRLRGRPA